MMSDDDIKKRLEFANIARLAKIVGISKWSIYAFLKGKGIKHDPYKKLVEFFNELDKKEDK